MKKTACNDAKTKLAMPASLNHSIFIAWKPEYDIGIPIIDEQHRGVVSFINSLYYGMQNHYTEDMLDPIVSIMYDYTKIHFNLEENFFKTCCFPDAASHHALHQELIDRLSSVGRNSILERDPYQFLDFLKKWWVDHICDKDRVFGEYILCQLQIKSIATPNL